MVVVDDALLLDVLAGTAAPELLEARRQGQVATTGSWYWRAARAVAGGGHGALSRRVDALPSTSQDLVRSGADQLPPDIALISLRHLVPVMVRLPRPADLLTLEAVAVARLLNAQLLVSTTSSLLEELANSAGVSLRVAASS
ncbi:MAG: hypothetical protein M3137_07140 [Actinomycetota bacterium]|nr:hypothetical protein [Actinomycetota bacterium]